MAKNKNTVSAATEELTDEAHEEVMGNEQHIRINGTPFVLPAPYASGHVLTDGEAQALNKTFAENIRNNIAAKMRAAAEKNEAIPDQEVVNAYASSYQFGVRSGSTRVVDPVANEERKLASTAVKRALEKKGAKLKEFDKEKLEAFISIAVASGRFRTQAENIVAERAGTVDLDFDELAEAA